MHNHAEVLHIYFSTELTRGSIAQNLITPNVMKKLIIAAALAVMATSFANAQIPVQYQGEVDAGYSIGTGTFASNRVNLHTVQGVKIGQYFSTGIGIGLDYYHQMSDNGELIVPIYLNLKGYLPVSEKIIPYLSFDIGAGIGATTGVSGLSEVTYTPALGVRIGMFKAQIGYNVQRLSQSGIGFNMGAVQIKAGIVF